MQDTVTLAHGAGGKQTSELIEKVFKAHFSNPYFTPDDSAVLQIPAGKMAMSTPRIQRILGLFPRRKYRQALNLRNGQRSGLVWACTAQGI